MQIDFGAVQRAWSNVSGRDQRNGKQDTGSDVWTSGLVHLAGVVGAVCHGGGQKEGRDMAKFLDSHHWF